VTARLLSVNVGLPRDVAWAGKTVHTAVWKEPVRGRRMARRLNIDGDGRGDLAERLRFGASASLIAEPPIGEFPNGL
jgi:hypothetical protein